MTTPTPDIVHMLKKRGHDVDLKAATTIEELREAVRVLGELHAARLALRGHMSVANIHRLNLAEQAVLANPIARAACEEQQA